jgi:hypothetical protein
LPGSLLARTYEWMNRFSWNLVLGSFIKICKHVPVLVKNVSSIEPLTWRRTGVSAFSQLRISLAIHKVKLWWTCWNCCALSTFSNFSIFIRNFLAAYWMFFLFKAISSLEKHWSCSCLGNMMGALKESCIKTLSDGHMTACNTPISCVQKIWLLSEHWMVLRNLWSFCAW